MESDSYGGFGVVSICGLEKLQFFDGKRDFEEEKEEEDKEGDVV